MKKADRQRYGQGPKASRPLHQMINAERQGAHIRGRKNWTRWKEPNKTVRTGKAERTGQDSKSLLMP